MAVILGEKIAGHQRDVVAVARVEAIAGAAVVHIPEAGIVDSHTEELAAEQAHLTPALELAWAVAAVPSRTVEALLRWH